jgi:predicted amidohydrolase
MSNVLVALWSYKSYYHYGTPWASTAKTLRTATEFAQKIRGTAPNLDIESKNAFDTILVAPEYLFGQHRTDHKRGPMSKKSKIELVAELKAISKAHPKTLIIAGSIFYREEIDTMEAKAKLQQNLTAAAVTTVTRYGAWSKEQQKSDVILQGYKANKKQVPGLNTLAKANVTCRAYNTSYAFLGGELAWTPYNKECDFKETEGARPDVIAYVPGASSGMREVGGFQFGVEICADHAMNQLNGKQADFHVIVSDHVDTRPAQNIGAYLLHASSVADQTGVWKKGDANRMPALGNGKPDKDNVVCWLVPVPQRIPQADVPKAPPVKHSGPVVNGIKLPANAVKVM